MLLDHGVQVDQSRGQSLQPVLEGRMAFGQLDDATSFIRGVIHQDGATVLHVDGVQHLLDAGLGGVMPAEVQEGAVLEHAGRPLDMARPLERHLLVRSQADPPRHRQVNAFEVEVVAGIRQPLHEGVGARGEDRAPGAVGLLDAAVQRRLCTDQLTGTRLQQRRIALGGELARQGLPSRIGEQTQRMFGAGRLQPLAQRRVRAGVGMGALIAHADVGHVAVNHIPSLPQPLWNSTHALLHRIGDVQLAKQAAVVAGAWIPPLVVQQIELGARQRQAGAFQHPGLHGDIVQMMLVRRTRGGLVRLQRKRGGLGLAQDIARRLRQQGIGAGIQAVAHHGHFDGGQHGGGGQFGQRGRSIACRVSGGVRPEVLPDIPTRILADETAVEGAAVDGDGRRSLRLGRMVMQPQHPRALAPGHQVGFGQHRSSPLSIRVGRNGVFRSTALCRAGALRRKQRQGLLCRRDIGGSAGRVRSHKKEARLVQRYVVTGHRITTRFKTTAALYGSAPASAAKQIPPKREFFTRRYLGFGKRWLFAAELFLERIS